MSLVVAPVPVVVDASVVIGAATDEPPAIAALDAVQARVLLAPPLMWVETANVLVRRKHFSVPDAVFVLRSMERLGLESADRGFDGLVEAMALAEKHALSVYDATYLWLALDIDGELATLDRDLANAAVAEGVSLAIKIGD